MQLKIYQQSFEWAEFCEENSHIIYLWSILKPFISHHGHRYLQQYLFQRFHRQRSFRCTGTNPVCEFLRKLIGWYGWKNDHHRPEPDHGPGSAQTGQRRYSLWRADVVHVAASCAYHVHVWSISRAFLSITRIIDYYLHLLPGVTPYHARQRLTLLSCYDASPKSLTEKILERPRLIQRIKDEIKIQWTGSYRIIQCDHAWNEIGAGAECAHIWMSSWLVVHRIENRQSWNFQKLGIELPYGFENLKNEDEIANALAQLKINDPHLQKAVVKLNDGFSGEGNAIFHFDHYDANDKNLAQNILT